MEIIDYDVNKGIIPIKLGNARIIIGYSRLLHIINLDSYEQNVQIIKHNINTIQTFGKERTGIKGLYKIRLDMLQMKFKKLEETLDHLRPRLRNKRGLINGLGSIIKSITGNMDHDDYDELGRAIAEINRNEDVLQNKYNDQININTKMINRFNDIQNFVNDQTRKIEFELKSVENSTQSFANILKLDQSFHRSVYNIELLNDHLSDIIEAISMAKLKIISRHILNHKELDYIQNHFSKFNVNLKTEESIYSLLWLQAYYNQSQIIFSIQIPNFHPDILFQYKIKSITFNETYTIIPPNPYIILNEHIYQYPTKPCNEVESIQYCEKQDPGDSSKACIPQIINNKQALCNLTEQKLQNEIEQLSPEYVFISTKEEIPISSTCHQKQKSIKGIKLIFFKNCTINLNQEEYSNTLPIMYEDITALQPYNDIIINDIQEQIKLTTLRNWTIHNNKKIQILHLATENHSLQRNIFTSSIIILTIISLIYFSVRKWLNKKPEKPEQEIHIEVAIPKPDTKSPAVLKRTLRTPLRGEELRPLTSTTQISTMQPST